MRYAIAVVAVAAAISALAPTESGAAPLPSFAGSCSFGGVETFTPPLALSSRPGSATVTASGRCSGRLVDAAGRSRTLRGAAASYHQATIAPTISCIGGTARGQGVLTIDGTSLAFTVTEPQLTVLSTLRYTAPAWSGSGFASVAPSANPLALTLACLGGGITTVPVILVAQLRAP